MKSSSPFPRIEPLSRTAAARILGSTGAASPAMQRMLERFGRLFRLRSPFAPGLECIAGTISLDGRAEKALGAPVLSATGNGIDQPAALVSCLSEAAEYLSSIEAPGDIVPGGGRLLRAGWIARAKRKAPGRADFTAAVDAASGLPALLPADLCLRRDPARRAIQPVGALSAGVAAGAGFDAAAERAILELIERDAAALWQFGGRHPRRAGRKAQEAGQAMLARLRQGCGLRETRLLDLTADTGVPVIAAWSADQGGAGLACGIAARRTPAAAAEAAVLELAQMEMAAALSLMKLQERGAAALSEADRRHLARHAARPAEHPLLQPAPGTGPRPIGPERNLAPALRARGFQIFLVDLTRVEIGISAARAVCPELQPYSGEAVTPRLRALTGNRRLRAAVEVY